jgi:hypothetical protein
MLDNIGLPYSGINLSYSNAGTIGTPDAEILVSLKEGHRPTNEYVKLLREELPRRFPSAQFFFQPADIVTQILNFGVPAPIDVQIAGADQLGNYNVARQLANRIRRIPAWSSGRACATGLRRSHAATGRGSNFRAIGGP